MKSSRRRTQRSEGGNNLGGENERFWEAKMKNLTAESFIEEGEENGFKEEVSLKNSGR